MADDSASEPANTRSSPGSPDGPDLQPRPIAETLKEYAAPLLAKVKEETTREELLASLRLVVTIWNALTVDAWGAGTSHEAEVQAVLAGPQAPRELAWLYDEFVRRKRELFAEDLRAIGSFDLIQHGPGDFSLHAEARLPESLGSPEE
jgi:nitrate reductase NapE component